MISLVDETEQMVRDEVQKQYHGRIGGLSIFFEHVLREYFASQGKKKKK